MASRDRFAINTISNNSLALGDAIALYCRHGVRAITPWDDKVAELGLAETKRRLDDAGIALNGFCLAGLFAKHGRGNLAVALDHNRRVLDLAAALGAPMIVTCVGGLIAGERDLDYARRYAFEGMQALVEAARPYGITLGIEPLHPMYLPEWSVVTTIAEANDWAERLGAGVGIVVDTYHTWWDPALAEGIRRAGAAGRIAAVHVNDWLSPTSDVLLDRGMMGEGVIDIPKIRGWLDDAGFAGRLEVEIFSTRLWAADQDAYLAETLQRFEEHV